MVAETKPPGAAKRKQPSTARGRQTRAAIVDAAADLMYTQGVAATSVDQVIERSGTGKSQVYHYFSSKDDLVQAVIERQLERVLGGQPRLASIETWSDLVAWADDVVKMHRGPAGPLQCPLGTLAAEMGRNDAFRPAMERAFARWIELLHQAFSRLKDSGEIAAETQERALALRVMVLLQGGMLMAKTFDDATVLADSLDRFLAEVHPAPG